MKRALRQAAHPEVADQVLAEALRYLHLVLSCGSHQRSRSYPVGRDPLETAFLLQLHQCSPRLQPASEHWGLSKDGDPYGLQLYERHYSSRVYHDGRRRIFIGPGEKMVLLTPEADALFVWRKFLDDSGQRGVNCAVFRNEGKHRSSDLIREAMQVAWKRWPGERLYTFVNPAAIRSRNPGYCFKVAGWHLCGTTKGGLLIFEAL